MNLNLNGFSSYFEIFAALNLAYAGSELFRTAIDDEILSLNNTFAPSLKSKFEELKSEITVTVAEKYEASLQNTVDEVERFFTENSAAIISKEKYHVQFTEGFKSTFLMSALFCLAVILLGGFDQFFLNKATTNLSLLFFQAVLIYNFFVFFRTFTRFFHANIRPLKTIAIFAIFCGSSYFYCCYCPEYDAHISYIDPKLNIGFALFTAVSPYLLHFIRVYMHKIFYRYKVMMIERETRRKLNIIENWVKFPINGNLKAAKGGVIEFICIFLKSLKRNNK